MSTIVSTCPQTGKEVSTGINVDLNTFSMLPDVPVEFRCPQCGKTHALPVTLGRLSDRLVPENTA
jgi:predicted RNA-binding Zn-ribbon protein involved in translation (DUF1610 family)